MKTPLQKEVLEASFQSKHDENCTWATAGHALLQCICLHTRLVGWWQSSHAAIGYWAKMRSVSLLLSPGAAAVDANPTQQHRKALAEKLELSEEQVQVWLAQQYPNMHMQLRQGSAFVVETGEASNARHVHGGREGHLYA